MTNINESKRKSNPLDEACIEISEKIENENIVENENNIESEFNNWKINTSLLYDFVSRKELEWPSLSLDFGHADEKSEDNLIKQTVCVGTHTSNKERNFLYVCEVLFPLERLTQDKCIYKINDDYEGFEFGKNEKKFKVKSKIAHDGEINRIKFLPGHKNFVVTKAVTGNLHLFDINKHEIESHDTKMKPEVTFDGNETDGFGIDFNTKKNHVVTCCNDGLITLYDFHNLTASVIHPLQKTKYKVAINDVAFTHDPNLFLASGDNGYILLFDLRQNLLNPVNNVLGQQVPVNTLSYNHFNNIFASGSDNGKIKIWNIKKFNEPEHIISFHNNAIIRLNFSSTNKNLLASATSKRFINVYDLNKIGEELSENEISDGPSELIFTHGGHKESITDFNWNNFHKLEFFIGSTSEDNTLQFWQIKKDVIQLDNENVETTENETDLE